MTLRPQSAQWFQLLTLRDQLPRLMPVLAATGAVELEVSEGQGTTPLFPGLAARLVGFHQLSQRYLRYWPAPELPEASLSLKPLEACEGAMAQVEAWRQPADPLIQRLEARLAEQRDLELLSEALAHGGAALPDPALLAAASELIEARLYFAAEELVLKQPPALLLARAFETPRGFFLLLVGRPPDIKTAADQLRSATARLVPLPAFLPPNIDAAIEAVAERQRQLATVLNEDRASLDALNRQYRIAQLLGVQRLADWLAGQADALHGGDVLALVTGWTSDVGGEAIRPALDAARLRYLFVASDTAPLGKEPPVILHNAPLARRFEMFTRLLGIPARDAVDPSQVLALIAPLLFGYMFGDVGQGAVVALLGRLLGRRMPALQFLVPSGLMAMLFGVLFGSVFSREDVIPALWFHPLQHPIDTLAGGLVIGIAILTTGLVLNALQAHWRRRGSEWWLSDAGMILCYGGVLASFFNQAALAVALAGSLWFLFGRWFLAAAHDGSSGAVIADFIETLFQLLVNTVSFARVGAFALAHAGLSVAIVGVAEAAGGAGYWIILLLGNVLVIALEGLVIGIQTTRLMLFEFFTRFFKGGGRPFRALLPPDRDQSPFIQPTTSKA